MNEMNEFGIRQNSGDNTPSATPSRNYLQDVKNLRSAKTQETASRLVRNEPEHSLGQQPGVHYTPRPPQPITSEITKGTKLPEIERRKSDEPTNIGETFSRPPRDNTPRQDVVPITGQPTLVAGNRRKIPDFDNMVEISVIGVGGGGSNSVGRMEPVPGVTYIIANTDSRALAALEVDHEIHLGRTRTRGKGAGGRVERGRAAAEEAKDSIYQALEGSEIVFITACLGGGTGSGAGPVIAEIANSLTIGEDDVLTVGIVTMPFSWEGSKKRGIAESALEEFRKNVDAVIVIENDLLASPSTGEEIDDLGLIGIEDEFRLTDKILADAIQGLSEIITVNGLWNLDISDFRSTLEHAGDAVIAIGSCSGDARAVGAAQNALANPLINTDITNAKRLLINVVGPSSTDESPLTREEIRKIKEVVGERSHPTECDVFTGVMLRDDLDDEIHVTIVAADFEQFEPTTIDMALNESTKQLERPDMSSIPTLTDLRKSLNEALPIPNIEPIETIKSQDASTADTKTTSPSISADIPSDWTDTKPNSASPLPLDPTRQSAPYFNEDIPDR
jgi:cell division protein FtsZ